jgi:hypothetical protein
MFCQVRVHKHKEGKEIEEEKAPRHKAEGLRGPCPKRHAVNRIAVGKTQHQDTRDGIRSEKPSSYALAAGTER